MVCEHSVIAHGLKFNLFLGVCSGHVGIELLLNCTPSKGMKKHMVCRVDYEIKLI